MNIQSIVNKLLTGIFLLFAAVQINDQDYFIWVPIYLIVAIVILLYDQGTNVLRALQVLLVAYILGMISYYPDVISWIQEGTPSIAGSMKAESPFIEFVREFFGLGICAITLGYYCYLASREKDQAM